jgi:hypothetical protein
MDSDPEGDRVADHLLDRDLYLCTQVEEGEVHLGKSPGVSVALAVERHLEDGPDEPPLNSPHEKLHA